MKTRADLRSHDRTTFLRLGDARPKRLPTLAAAQKKPGYVRVVKDILRTGRWHIGYENDGSKIYWTVTPETLTALEKRFREHRDLGIRHPLCWGHGDPFTKIVDARDCIADIDQVLVAGNTLWGTFYVPEAQAKDLQTKPRHVSVRVWPKWTDGRGRDWDMSLLHVAVVDHAVMDGQGPFVEMKLKQKPKGKVNMAVTFDTLVAGINQLLPGDMELPTDGEGAVTEENFDQAFAMVLSLVGKGEEEETEPAPVGGSEIEGGGLEEMPAELSTTAAGKWLAGFAAEIRKGMADLSTSVKTVASGAAKNRQAAFTTRLNELATEGRVKAKHIDGLMSQGRAMGWDLSILEPFGDVAPSIDMSNTAKAKAKAKPPAIPKSADAEPTQEDIDRMARSMGAKPKKTA